MMYEQDETTQTTTTHIQSHSAMDMQEPSAIPSFSTHYQPTPLEKAYALYLLETVLQVPREPFRLTGRIAVPFLSSSGVNRTLLREVWTLVDPKMEGSLMELIQFTSVLKLVSLAQHKWLDLAQYEGLLQFRQVPLATFANLVVPNNQYLLERHPFVTKQMPLLVSPMHQLSVSDAFGDLDVVDAPMPTLPAVVPDELADEDFGDMQGVAEQQQPVATTSGVIDDDDFGAFEEQGVTKAVVQAADAFGGLEVAATTASSEFPDNNVQPIEDQPLPSKGSNNDDFGDSKGTVEDTAYPLSSTFGGIQPVPDQALPLLNVQLPADKDDDDFGGFEGTGDVETIEPQFEDDFGDFETTTVEPSAVAMPQADPASSAFDEMPTIQNQLLPTFGDSSVPQQDVTDLDPFSSAFDALQPVENQPLPSLSAISAPVEPEEDDFGDFEGIEGPGVETQAASLPSAFDALQPIENQPLPTLGFTPTPVQMEDDDFGGFGGTTDSVDMTPVGPMSSAFDALQPVENQPLQSLGALSAPLEPDEDGHVDFEGVPGDETPAAQFPSAFDAVQPVENQPLPSFGGSPARVQIEDNDFGDFEGTTASVEASPAPAGPMPSAFDALQTVENQPLPSLGAIDISAPLEPEEDDFGNFEGFPGGETPAPADQFPSAFVALQPVKNQPLPSFGVTPAPVQIEDDDFGDFEGTADSVEASPAPVGLMSSAFDALQPVENRSLPSLGVTPTPAEMEGDDFDDFEGTSTSVAEAPIEADPFGLAFDALQPIQNQPLPSLDMLSSPVEPEDDDFGDFEGTADLALEIATEQISTPFEAAQSVQDQSVPSVAVDEDDFGNFEGEPPATTESIPDTGSSAFDIIPPSEDQPYPSTGTIGVDGSAHHFGGFENTAESMATDAYPDPFSLAFDDLQPVKDAPLRSLDAVVPPVPHFDTEGDDFGDFEGTEAVSPVGGGDAHPEESAVSEEAFGGFGQPLTGNDVAPSSGDGIAPIAMQVGETAISQPAQPRIQDDDNPFSVFDALGGVPPTQTLAPLSSYSFGSEEQLSTAEPLAKESSFGDFKTPTGDLSPAPGIMSAIPLAPAAGVVTAVIDADDFGDFKTPAESIATTPIESGAPLDILNLASAFSGASVLDQQPQKGEDSGDFGDFEGVQAAVPDPVEDSFGDFEGVHETAAAPDGAEDSFGNFEGVHEPRDVPDPVEDSFSDFEGVQETAPTVSVIDDFGDFEGVEAPTNITGGTEAPVPPQEADLMNDFASFVGTAAAPISNTTFDASATSQQDADPMDDFASFAAATEAPVTSAPPAQFDAFAAPAPVDPQATSDDDDDWGDFEHVQAPPAPEPVTKDDEIADFASAPPPTENDFANAFRESEPADSAAFAANFDNVPGSTPAAVPTPDEDDFGDWDGFQEAPAAQEQPPAVKEPQGPPQTLEEFRDRLGGMHLPGSLSKLNLTTLLGRNIITPIRIGSSMSSGGNSTLVAMQRAQRCYQLVTVLCSSSGHEQLVLTHWMRVLTVARDELTMGSFLLQQAKKLLSGSSSPNKTKQEKQQQTLEIKKSLSTMVASLGECVRVVRSIVATVADIMCLDLGGNKKKSKTTVMDKEFASLELIQLSLQIEDLWKAMTLSSKRELRFRPTLEECAAIQKQAWEQATGVELCQLTLQPLVHDKATSSSVTNTKCTVQFQDKAFMACAANLWVNRISAEEGP
jgi:hypothetical protein